MIFMALLGLTQVGFLLIPIVSCGVGVEPLISEDPCITP